MDDSRPGGGLWTALFIILLLPLLFFDPGQTALFRPGPRYWRGLMLTGPKAEEIWHYRGAPSELICWLGGPLAAPQTVESDKTGKIIIIDDEGAVVGSESIDGSCIAISDGERLVLATATGQVKGYERGLGVRWSDSSGWPGLALALDSLGSTAVVQGPVFEGDGNLLERVRFYDERGSYVDEYALRNLSAVAIAPGSARWYLSAVLLGTSETQGQVLGLSAPPGGSTTLWRSPDIAQAMAVNGDTVAVAAGQWVYITEAEAEAGRWKPKNPATDLAWLEDDMLAVIESGTRASSAGRLLVVNTKGQLLWHKRLAAPGCALAVRPGELLVGDRAAVYSFTVQGDLRWSYQSAAPVQGLYPLAGGQEVLVSTAGNNLVLLTPPKD